MPNTFNNVTSAVTQKNAHTLVANMVAFINANGGISKSATGCRQNALGAVLIGSFSYLAKNTYGTNFGTLVPNAS
jgi:hypothetical protein